MGIFDTERDRILDSQRKRIIDCATSAGLDSKQIQIGESGDFFLSNQNNFGIQVKYKGTQFNCSINPDISSFFGVSKWYINTHPDAYNENKFDGSIVTEERDLDIFFEAVDNWCKAVARELASKNYLSDIFFKTKKETFSKANDSSERFTEENFTEEEKSFVKYKFSEFEARIKALELEVKEKQAILDAIKEIKESSNKLTKKDWKNQAVGAIINVLISLALNHDTSAVIWNGFLAIVNGFPALK